MWEVRERILLHFRRDIMKMLINGEFVDKDARIEVENPATNEIIDSVPSGDSEDIEGAVSAAARAFEGWKKESLERKRKTLLRIAGAVREHADELARLLVLEVGKPIPEARHEALSSARVFEEFASLDVRDEVIRNDGNALVIAARRPLGPAGLILPWNYPLAVMAWKLAPALLAGDTVVVKPSPYTPLNALKFGEIVSPLLSPGVLNIVTGGDDTGKALVEHPEIRKIAFTGHVETGRAIMSAAAKNLKRISLELGGNDPAIILRDFDMKNLPSVFWSAFRNAGQVCIAVKRIYVHESIYSEFVEGLCEIANSVRLGNGLEEGTQMGPVNNPEQLGVVERLVREAEEKGGKILTGGRRKEGAGYFYYPTVITDVDESVGIVAEEQFGPVVPVMPFSDEDEAVERANSLPFGLGASVWTQDINRGMSIASRLEAGTAWVNTHMLVDHLAPFGGFKQSGIGRELGIHGLNEYVEFQTLYVKR